MIEFMLVQRDKQNFRLTEIGKRISSLNKQKNNLNLETQSECKELLAELKILQETTLKQDIVSFSLVKT